MEIEWIDTHCHLDYEGSEKPATQLVQEAMAAGVRTLINIGTDLPTLSRVQDASDRFSNVYHTVGVHPHEAVTVAAGDLEKIREAARHPKCLAIGEIGLDYHYDHSPREVQRRILDQQLDMALECGLPIVVHTREAEEDQLESLKRYVSRLPLGADGCAARIPGVIHCFTSSQAFGQACLALGFYISFSGILTFKAAEELRVAAKAYPLDRLLVETDSPFLAPAPMRGRKCEPSMVIHTGRKLAEIKQVGIDEVARITTQNARKVFGIPSPS
jgi:TatD DNase family protein